MSARYVVGIDLGTTHTAVAYVDVHDPSRARAPEATTIFRVPQLVSAVATEPRELLPSSLYAPLPDEGNPGVSWIVGEHARRRSAEVPGRSITSAKSWLVHGGVDRSAPILPWGASSASGASGVSAASGDEPEAPRLSPIDAEALIVRHLRKAWDAAFPDDVLAEQTIVLTVPASFDEVARSLTLEATRRAGLPAEHVRLLEEPQAAFLDFARSPASRGDRALLALLERQPELDVIVCDVGGGTTDFSLIRVRRDEAAEEGIALERVAVGDHLLLGGDNMDLALAHRLEPRIAGEGTSLGPAEFAQLALACRSAKEELLRADVTLESVTVTLASRGSRLVSGARRASLHRDDFREVVIDGFFPEVTRDDLSPRGRARGGLVAFGLPYAKDPAITRHLAAFLGRIGVALEGRKLAILLNGGVFHAQALAERIVLAVQALTGVAPSLLPYDAPDLAVARGAVAHGLAHRGLGLRIAGGSAHAYYVGVGGGKGVCVVPRGAEAGEKHVARGRTLALTVGRAARFPLFASASGTDREGDVVELGELGESNAGSDESRFLALAPLATVITASDGEAREVNVELQGEISELGTLELSCLEKAGRAHRLAFELRAGSTSTSTSMPPPSMSAPARSTSLPPPRSVASVMPSGDRRLDEARARVDRVFGKPSGDVDPREAKSLARDLEKIFGERDAWPTSIVRPLFDAVAEGAKNRKRSADHERVFWSLAGFLLRPGFGDPLDEGRVRALEPLYLQGLGFPKETNNFRAWWIAWRRIAGGVSEAGQVAIRDQLDPFLAMDEAGTQTRPRKKPKNVRAEPWDEVLFLASSLERVPTARRGELGTWILERTWTSTEPALYAAIGRLGARVPVYASAHHVISPRLAETWLGHVLRADWKSITSLPFAATQLARCTGDRARDVSGAMRAEVEKRLVLVGAKPEWARMVREVVVVDDAERRERFGEALPLGLRLLQGTEFGEVPEGNPRGAG